MTKTEHCEPIVTAHEITAPDGRVFIAMAGSQAYEDRNGYLIREVRGYATRYGFREI